MMNIRKAIVWSALISGFVLTTSSVASAWGGDRTACETSSQKMRWACHFDVRDDYYEMLANCQNIAHDEERLLCRSDAREIRGEGGEECRDVYSARLDACDALNEDRYDPDPLLNGAIEFIDPNDVPDLYPANPYVSVAKRLWRELAQCI